MANKKDLSFEAALESLEVKISRLESGELSLDASLTEFEEAVKLVKICNEKIECAKQKVRILTEGADGAITDAPFSVNENEA